MNNNFEKGRILLNCKMWFLSTHWKRKPHARAKRNQYRYTFTRKGILFPTLKMNLLLSNGAEERTISPTGSFRREQRGSFALPEECRLPERFLPPRCSIAFFLSREMASFLRKRSPNLAFGVAGIPSPKASPNARSSREGPTKHSQVSARWPID